MKNHTTSFIPIPKMPVLFIGHGSPMYAICPNEFTDTFTKIAQKIPTPKAILAISAHWVTQGNFVTAMDMPPTIHDFYGFPQALYDEKYNALGSVELASTIKDTIKKHTINLDTSWGLDHGTWAVLKYLYPKANIPVVQLSLNANFSPTLHYELGKSLYELRNKGILILGSGNIVHNLRHLTPHETYAHPWATTTKEAVNQAIKDKDHKTLIDFRKQGEAFLLSIPTTEHFLPLLYTLSLQDEDDSLTFFNDKVVNGGISMTSIGIGL